MSEAPYEEEPDHSYDADSSYLSADMVAYQRRRSFGRFIKLFLVFLLFASAVGLGGYLWLVRERTDGDLKAFKQGGVDTVESFLEDLRAGRLDEAYAVTSTDFRLKMNRKQFESYIRQSKGVLEEPFKDHRFETSQIGPAAFGKKVTGEYRGWRKKVTGKREEVTVVIVREGGAIKVEDLTISP